jgi:hypothetical protein
MRKALIATLSGAAPSAGVLARAAPAQANPVLPAPFFWLGAATGVTVGAAALACARQSTTIVEAPPPVVAPAPEPEYAPTVYAAPPAANEGPAIAAPAGPDNCAVVNRATATGWRSVEVRD